MSPKVAVVVPSFNCERFLLAAVSSCLSQSFTDLEVIVVDDGSSVPQREALEGVSDPRLRIVRQDNGGVARARNRGVAESQGEILAFLDADDIWLPDKLARQLPLLESGDFAVAFSDVYLREGDRNREATYLSAFAIPTGTSVFGPILRNNFIPLSSAVVRRKVFEEVGGFCERRDIWEDWHLWLRIAARHSVVCLREPLAIYRRHDANASGDVEQLVSRSLRTLEVLSNDNPGFFDSHLGDLRASEANLWFNLGYALVRERRKAEARSALKKAFSRRPAHLGTLKALVRTFT